MSQIRLIHIPSVSIYSIRTWKCPLSWSPCESAHAPCSDCVNCPDDVHHDIIIPILHHHHTCGITTIKSAASQQMWVSLC